MLDSQPSIAAIVATYNYARFLPRALDSLIGQTIPFEKIIVVDDGSTDHTREVLELYKGKVEAITIENRGQLGACIEGLKKAQSEYVYFLDADDYVVSDFHEIALSHLYSKPDKLQFQLHVADADGNMTDTVFPFYAPGYGSAQAIDDNRLLGFYICPPTSGNIFRRSLLETIDFSLLSMREPFDGTPALVIPYLGTIKSANIPLAFYRIHGDSHSHTGSIHAQLERELEMFGNRWQEAVKLFGWDKPPFGEGNPAYVLQRIIMRAAIENRMSQPWLLFEYIRKVSASHLPTRQRILLAGWAISFLLPSSALRRYAVDARRSVSNRPKALQRMLGRILGS